FSEAKKEGQLLAILFRQNSEKLLIAIVAKRLRAYQKLTGKQLSQYIISFWSNAIISVLEKWVAEDMSVS
ncbi:TetR/AcrR family transcriptional regulator, partial [Streptococcus suis]